MLKLLLFKCFVVAVNHLITPADNEERLKTCGMHNHPTSRAPWMLEISVNGEQTAAVGVIISQSLALITGTSVPRTSPFSLESLDDTCEKKNATWNVEAHESVCVDWECTKQKRNSLKMVDMRLIGECGGGHPHVYIVRFDGVFQNTPICLSNNRELKTLSHGFSHNNLELYPSDSTLPDNSKPMVRKWNGRFELVGISMKGPSFHVDIRMFEQEICVVSGVCPETLERSGRSAEPPVEFNKLTAEENQERLETCGRLRWSYNESDRSSTNAQAAIFFPWVLYTYKNGSSSDFDTLVVISKRHMLGDLRSLRFWNRRGILEDYKDKPPQVIREFFNDSNTLISGAYCGRENAICSSHPPYFYDMALKPSKVIIANSKYPKVVLFEFDQDIPINSICLPEKEVVKGEEVMIQSRDIWFNKLLSYNLFDVRQNGWAVHKTSDPKREYSQVLVKTENGRPTIAGNSDRHIQTTDSNYILFSSVFQYTERICKWTGVCPSLPRLQRLSVKENEERLENCGREHSKKRGTSLVSSSSDSTWIVSIERFDGRVHTGVVVSQRHILTDWHLLEGLDLNKTIRNYSSSSTISTSLPVMDHSETVLGFSVKMSTCADEHCESRKNETLRPTKMMMVHGTYVVLEMAGSMETTPLCVLNSWKIGKRNDSVFYSNDTSSDAHTMITLAGFSGTYTNDGEAIRIRPWNSEQENLCELTGICSRRMLPLQSKEVRKLTREENEKRRSTCGVPLDPTSIPWLVGIRKNNTSTLIHTGVLISSRHVLIDALVFGGDLSEWFGDYESRQPQVMSVNFPESQFPFEDNILVGILRRAGEWMKPSKMFLSDSSDPSVLILELSEDLPDVPICLQEVLEVKANDEVFTSRYGTPESGQHNVSSVLGEYILPNASPPSDLSEILVRKDGNRSVLVGNRLISGSPGNTSSTWFKSTFAVRHKICELTGVCPLFVSTARLEKISGEEDEQRSYECGLLSHPIGVQPQEPVIARDAPWIVGIRGPETRMHTGVVISRRHVLTNIHVFREELRNSAVFGDDWSLVFNSSLPLPRENFQWHVEMSICHDDPCNVTVQEVRIPREILVGDSTNGYVTFLEFDEDLPVPPICISETPLGRNDEVFIQDYTHPQSIFDSENVSDVIGNRIHMNWTNGKHSQVLVRNVDGRFTIVGNLKSSNSSTFATFSSVFSNRELICQWTGVCANASVPIREVLPRRQRGESLEDEFPDAPEFEDPSEEEDEQEEEEGWRGGGGRNDSGGAAFYHVVHLIILGLLIILSE